MAMSWMQKELRRDARRAGLNALLSFERAMESQEEADNWAQLGDCAERVAFWTARADKAERRTYQHACMAFRSAIRSMEES